MHANTCRSCFHLLHQTPTRLLLLLWVVRCSSKLLSPWLALQLLHTQVPSLPGCCCCRCPLLLITNLAVVLLLLLPLFLLQYLNRLIPLCLLLLALLLQQLQALQCMLHCRLSC
jgi:hypothetical protein